MLVFKHTFGKGDKKQKGEILKQNFDPPATYEHLSGR